MFINAYLASTSDTLLLAQRWQNWIPSLAIFINGPSHSASAMRHNLFNRLYRSTFGSLIAHQFGIDGLLFTRSLFYLYLKRSRRVKRLVNSYFFVGKLSFFFVVLCLPRTYLWAFLAAGLFVGSVRNLI